MAGDIHSLKKKLAELQAEIRRQAALTDAIVCKLHEGQHIEATRPVRDDTDREDCKE